MTTTGLVFTTKNSLKAVFRVNVVMAAKNAGIGLDGSTLELGPDTYFGPATPSQVQVNHVFDCRKIMWLD